MVVVKTEIRDQIVDAASKIFSRYGFKKTTMDEIAQAMYKGKSSIYYYFKSKEEIFEAVIEKEVSALKSELTVAINQAGTPEDKLRAYILTRMKAFQKMSNFYEALKSEYLSQFDFINKIRVKYDNNEIQTIEGILIKGQEINAFRIEDCHIAAIAIVTAMKGMEIPLFWSSEATNFDRRMENLLNVLFYGIVNR